MCPPLLAAIPAVLTALGSAGAAAGAGAVTAGAMGLSAGTMGAISASLGAISSITSFIGQTQAAMANKKAANLNFANKMTALGQQNVELSQQHSEDVLAGAVSQAQHFGRIAASASELGLGNATVTPWINASNSADARNLGVKTLNTNARRTEIGAEEYGAALERQSQINSQPAPSPLSLVLGLGKSALEGATTFSQAGGKFATGAGEG